MIGCGEPNQCLGRGFVDEPFPFIFREREVLFGFLNDAFHGLIIVFGQGKGDTYRGFRFMGVKNRLPGGRYVEAKGLHPCGRVFGGELSMGPVQSTFSIISLGSGKLFTKPHYEAKWQMAEVGKRAFNKVNGFLGCLRYGHEVFHGGGDFLDVVFDKPNGLDIGGFEQCQRNERDWGVCANDFPQMGQFAQFQGEISKRCEADLKVFQVFHRKNRFGQIMELDIGERQILECFRQNRQILGV